ncbi:g1966 [Coccomyxa viridis]|uniref:G1966 protein n=1 Tax=Coccomyxa viridis TaxID=1274662 RepID=A0ABP1FN38_9CHLO
MFPPQLCQKRVPPLPEASTVGEHHEDAAATATKAKAVKEINPAVALALLVADLAARLFCLSIFWTLLVVAILVSNASLCMALIHRKGLSVEAALGITVGFDMALAGASLAFMARRLSADIIKDMALQMEAGSRGYISRICRRGFKTKLHGP